MELKLRPYQQQIVNRFLSQPKLYLNLDVGLGKTRIALACALARKLHMLVLAPLSAIPSWYSENEKIGKPFNIIRYEGQHGTLNPKTLNILIMNYERFRISWQTKFLEHILQKFLIVFDEAHRVKNPDAQVSKKAYEFFFHAPNKLMLSGTPLDRFYEAYMQFLILEPTIWGLDHKKRPLSYYHFLNKYFYLNSYNRPTALKIKKHEFLNILKPYLITITREQVLSSIPALTETQLFLRDKEILEHNSQYLDLSFETLAKIYQECSMAPEKFEFILDYLDDNPRTIVFTYHLDAIKKYQERLKNHAYYITGDDKTALPEILNGNPNKPIIATYSLKEGINLQHTYHNVIYHTLPLSHRDYEQSRGRVYRIGQQEHVNVIHLMSHPFDILLYNIVLVEKRAVFDYLRKNV